MQPTGSCPFLFRLGRRRGFLLSVGLSSLFGAVVCLSWSLVAFLLMRLLQGAMLAGVFVSSYIARLELCDPPGRLMVAMVGSFVSVSAELLLPGFAVLCRDWPILQAVATLPLLALLFSYWCFAAVFPESPRWLLATDQIPQAKKSFREFATRNDVYLDEFFPMLLAEMDSTYGEDCRPTFHSVLGLRRTRVMWKNCLILSFTLFIGTGIQYCFTRNLHNYNNNFYFTYFLRVIAGALACIFICLSVNHFGRRGILLLSAIVTGLSSLLLLALTQYLHDGLVLVLSVLGLLFSQALSMLSAFFACEVMPTVIRGGCLGLVLAAGCVGMAASSLMELQSSSGYFLHHVVFASFAVLSVLCIMLLPESKRKSLPDSLKDGVLHLRIRDGHIIRRPARHVITDLTGRRHCEGVPALACSAFKASPQPFKLQLKFASDGSSVPALPQGEQTRLLPVLTHRTTDESSPCIHSYLKLVKQKPVLKVF
uniref:Solute carrier family 22 member 31 n=1 Tax=Oryzias sinensis TaxID=183150 RepID=A0A8C7XS19_9TELE